MKSCTYCGQKNDDGVATCRECGTEIGPAEQLSPPVSASFKRVLIVASLIAVPMVGVALVFALAPILALLFSLFFFAILAAPVVGPVIYAARSPTLPLPAKVGLVVAALFTAFYVFAKYSEALNDSSDFKGFRVLALSPFEYAFSAYTVVALVSLGLWIHFAFTRRIRERPAVVAGLTFIGCAIVGAVCGQGFLSLPFGDRN